MSDELSDAKEQLRMASPAEREMREMLMRIGGDDPDESLRRKNNMCHHSPHRNH